MLPRFYVPDLDPAVPMAALPPEEARHLTRVLRLGEGDEIAIFDGRGHEFRARVSAAARDRVQVELVERTVSAPEARVPIAIAQAVLKGDAMDTVVRDTTMMGAVEIAPIVTARTIGRGHTAGRGGAAGRGAARPGEGASGATARWTRVAVSSAKQCRRATVPAIAEVRSLEAWLAASGAGLHLLLVEPSAAGGGERTLQFLESHAPAALSLVVGPEGGWTADERAQAETAGCVPVTLGALTLRADAVAVVAIAMARLALGDL